MASTLLRSILSSDKHNITILTRSSKTIPSTSPPNITYKSVDYTNKEALVSALRGHEVCLSFIIAHLDPNRVGQKTLIQACITAGVKRFAPSEWGIKNDSGISEYEAKDEVAEYLQSLAADSDPPVLEYCLFQPSIFLDYFAHPYAPTPPLYTWPFFVDFQSRRAIILDSGNYPLVLTSAHDDAEILLRAIEDPRPWPRVGGIRGWRTTQAEILALGKKIRGGEWTVEYVTTEDIEAGVLKTEWVPRMDHPLIPKEKQEEYSRVFTVAFLKAIKRGKWDVGTEWNERFPDYEFGGGEKWLRGIWEGKE